MLSCSVGYAQLPNRPRSVASSAKDSCPIEPARFEIGLTQSSNRPNPIDQLSTPSFLIGYARFVNRTRPVANFRQQIYKKLPHIVQNPPTFYNILIQPPNAPNLADGAALLGFGSVGFEIRLLRVSGLAVRKIALQMLIFTAVGLQIRPSGKRGRAVPSAVAFGAALLGFGSVGFEIRLLRVSGLTVRKIAFQMLISHMCRRTSRQRHR